MSIRAIVTLGYGSWGTIPDVARLGYGSTATVTGLRRYKHLKKEELAEWLLSLGREKEIIERVAEKQVERLVRAKKDKFEPALEAKQQNELIAELENEGISFLDIYGDLLISLRNKLLDEQIKLYLKETRLKLQEEEDVLTILMMEI